MWLTADGAMRCCSSRSAMPRSIAVDGSSGVEGTLWKATRPSCSSSSVKSVNVPPTSIPMRYTLFELDPGFLDHFAPFDDLDADALAEFGGRIGDDNQTLGTQQIAHRGRFQCAADFLLNPAHDFRRRFGRRDKAEPHQRFVARIPGF